MKKEIDRHEFTHANAELASQTCNDSPKSAPKLAPKLAIVVPCYNEEAVVAHTYSALCQKLDSLIAKESFLCFVDDGSRTRLVSFCFRLKSPHTNSSNSPATTDTKTPFWLDFISSKTNAIV